MLLDFSCLLWLLFLLMLCRREKHRKTLFYQVTDQCFFFPHPPYFTLVDLFLSLSSPIPPHQTFSVKMSFTEVIIFFILTHKSITTTIYKFLVIFKTKTHLHMQQ